MWFIQKDKQGIYFESDKHIETGLTFPDYMFGKTIMLSDDQYRYHQYFPTKTIEEVLNVDTFNGTDVQYHIVRLGTDLDDAKNNKINALEEYNDSVKDFIINDTLHAWFNPNQLESYTNYINASKLLENQQIQLVIADNLFVTTVNEAERMLASIQLYINQCSIAMFRHKKTIQSMSTVEEVDNYNYTTGYPQKLSFDLQELQ